MTIKELLKEQIHLAGHAKHITKDWNRYRQLCHFIREYFPLRHNKDIIINRQGY